MKKALESQSGFFPADAEPAIVLQPGDGAFDSPAPLVSAQRSSVLSDGTVGPIRRDHFNALDGQLRVELVAVVGFIANDALGSFGAEHEAEEFLDEAAFVGIGRRGAHGQRQSARIDQNHDFNALSGLGAADPVAATLGFGEGPIDKALVESEAPVLLDEGSHRAHEFFEDPRFDPAQKPPVDAALGAVSLRQILPLRAVVEHPEDARQGLPFVRRRSPAFRTRLMVRNKCFENIELRFAKCQHATL